MKTSFKKSETPSLIPENNFSLYRRVALRQRSKLLEKLGKRMFKDSVAILLYPQQGRMEVKPLPYSLGCSVLMSVQSGSKVYVVSFYKKKIDPPEWVEEMVKGNTLFLRGLCISLQRAIREIEKRDVVV